LAKPFSRAQAAENRAFLKLLARTGNVRLACRELGLKYGTMQHRRRVHPAFATRWDAALVLAQAGLKRKEERSFDKLRTSGRGKARPHPNPSPEGEGRFRTVAGEPHLVRLKNGKLQMQRAQPGKLTPAAEQAFLAAVSATGNLSLAAAAVGSCFGAFNRRRHKDPVFARELRLALQAGYEALEQALMMGTVGSGDEQDEWRHNDPPATPPMTANQALQLMYLHQKAVLMLDEPSTVRRRRGESRAAHSERLAQLAEAREARQREAFVTAEAERWARGEPPWGPAGAAVRRELGPPERFGLPDLAQVSGWSRGDPKKVPHDCRRALFGGWRIENMEKKRGGS